MTNGTEMPTSPPMLKTEHALAVYQAAQANAHHAETVMWTINAVMWGANTALLTFVLKDSGATPSVIVVIAPAGLVFTGFVAHMWHVFRSIKNVSFKTCQEIEKMYSFPCELRVHRHINMMIPKGAGTAWARVIGLFFGTAWMTEFLRALWLLWHGHS